MSVVSATHHQPGTQPVQPESVTRPSNRLGPRWLNTLKWLFGLPPARRLGRAALMVPRIRHHEAEYAKMTEPELRQVGSTLRGRARGGESLDKLLPEAFGAVCVSAWRALKMRPFDVQLAAGVIMHKGALAELATGEGKTLSACLPAFLNALPGKGVHVTTVNDYLARRDAEWMSPVFQMLGLRVGALQQQMSDQDRFEAYRSDITYGTASEFGFDFLRDRLKVAGAKGQESPFWAAWGAGFNPQTKLDPKVQREHNYALVDEADNIFIDEARTPMIISGMTRPATPEECIAYHWADDVARQMEFRRHFSFDEKKQKIELTEEGKHLVRYSNPPVGEHSHALDKLHEHVERGLHAHYKFRLDQHYMIKDDKVVIIDESTGRPQPDRHWRDGLHQAVEAKEGVSIHKAADHAAQITYQSYFKLYKKLSGMTGTVKQNWIEILRVYRLWVVCIPTNRACIREYWPDRVFATEDAKFDAAAAEIIRLRDLGRALLVGTGSVERSEKLSAKLQAAGVPHKVLNAKEHEREAEVVAEAGQPGKVTIATNMAGRGTDIKLHPTVAAAGGLHVLGTERHESIRIDRQLSGRSARQGDPGSAQFFVSVEDEILEGLTKETAARWKAFGQRGGNRNWQQYLPIFRKAQGRVEWRHYRQRVDLMVYEKQRQEILKDLGADPYVD